MKKGTVVSWQVALAVGRGRGTVITDEQDGHVLVAVQSLFGEEFCGYHLVICCSVTWLTGEGHVDIMTNGLAAVAPQRAA